jgi:hypothetical protein
MVARTRLIVMLYVHCLSCLFFESVLYVLRLCADLSLNYFVCSVKTDEDSGGKERVKRDDSNYASANLQDIERVNKSLH